MIALYMFMCVCFYKCYCEYFSERLLCKNEVSHNMNRRLAALSLKGKNCMALKNGVTCNFQECLASYLVVLTF